MYSVSRKGEMSRYLSEAELIYAMNEEPETEDDDFSSGSDEEYELPPITDATDDTPEGDDPLHVAKDGTVCKQVPFQSRIARTKAANVITLRPGVTRYAKSRVDSITDI